MLTGDNDSVFTLWTDNTIETDEVQRSERNQNVMNMHRVRLMM